MKDEDVKAIIREKGLCGFIADGQVCIMDARHDGGVHEPLVIPRAIARHLAYIEADFESIRRGGSCRTAVCVCGWRGGERGTLEMATDDALVHERAADQGSANTRRNELLARIASNKDWLSKNWHHGKDVRRGCQANIDADERELAELDKEHDNQ